MRAILLAKATRTSIGGQTVQAVAVLHQARISLRLIAAPPPAHCGPGDAAAAAAEASIANLGIELDPRETRLQQIHGLPLRFGCGFDGQRSCAAHRFTAATGSASHLRDGSDDQKVETMSSDLTNEYIFHLAVHLSYKQSRPHQESNAPHARCHEELATREHIKALISGITSPSSLQGRGIRRPCPE
jgi:hypothetical protein